MHLRKRRTKAVKTALQWTKTMLVIGIASALITTAWLPWTTRISLFPGHLLYDYETEVQLAMAALFGVISAGVTYLVLRRFLATVIISLIAAGVLVTTGVLVGTATEKLGDLTTLALMSFPALAAVATKAANIASKKECDTGVYRKFKESFEAAVEGKNFAELLLWTIAWASGGFGVFFLIKAIEMW